MTEHRNIFLSYRRRIAAAAATLFASTAFAAFTAWAADPATASEAAFSRVGATLPVADFQADSPLATNARARASGFASLLVGDRVQMGGSLLQRTSGQAQFQVRIQNGVRTLAEVPRVQPAVQGTARADRFMSDADIAARAVAFSAKAAPEERVRVLVDNEQHALLAVNGAVADDYLSTADVGPERARAAFETTMQSLSSNRLVSEDALALGAVRTHRLMQGEQAAGGPVHARVKEYLFEVPHAIGGIEVFGAATTVTVHRSGQLASIRTVGPAVHASSTGETVTRAVASQALAQRAITENPHAKVVAMGLRYPWMATRDMKLASRPREAFEVIPTTVVDGRQVNGRVHYVFYSVEDERAAPLVWPTPNPMATGDVRK